MLAIARSVAVRRSARTSAISTYVRASVRIAAPDLLAGHIAGTWDRSLIAYDH